MVVRSQSTAEPAVLPPLTPVAGAVRQVLCEQPIPVREKVVPLQPVEQRSPLARLSDHVDSLPDPREAGLIEHKLLDIIGSDPAFLRALDDQSEVFVGDVHCDQRIYLDDPPPRVPPPATPRGRPPTRRQAHTPAVRVDRWAHAQPAAAWQRVTVRDGTKGPLQVDIRHRRVWLWDGTEPQARQWPVLVRREVDTPTEIKYSLSNAPVDTPAPPTGVHARATLLD
ncbi:MAG: transposase [Candidatus Competibacteraceae bacterium]